MEGSNRLTDEYIKHCRKSAEAGDARAMRFLGKCYFGGDGVNQDYAEAVKWYRKAAEAGDAEAMNDLGKCYFGGDGVNQDYAEAAKWFRKAAEAGNDLEINNPELLYEAGKGVKQDHTEAAKWYQKALDNGCQIKDWLSLTQRMKECKAKIPSQPTLTWDINNESEKVKQLRNSAEAGNAISMNNLGGCFENGDGVDQDYAQAAKWYRKAAESGVVAAMNNLGECLENGRGVNQDYFEAAKWYQKAAEAGYALAMNNLGNCYLNGYGVKQDNETVFDFIFAERQRRYIVSFSAYACIFLEGIEPPDAVKITGLSPVIISEQKAANKNIHSIVDTTTKIYDYMRLLYARAGRAYSYVTGEEMVKHTEEEVLNIILNDYVGKHIFILAPLVKSRKGHYRELFESMRRMGYLNIRVDGELMEITRGMKADRYKKHDIEVVIDKLQVSNKDEERLKKSVAAAMKESEGLVMILDKDTGAVKHFSKRLMCPTTGISYSEPEPNNFSFKLPKGACPRCKGLGVINQIDLSKVIPDHHQSIHEGAIIPLGKYKNQMIFWQIEAILKKYDLDLKTPIEDIPEKALREMLYGSLENVRIDKDLVHTSSDYYVSFDGIIKYLRDVMDNDDSTADQKWADQFFVKCECPECHGQRLNRKALSYRVWDKNIAELASMDLTELREWLDEVEQHLDHQQQQIAHEILKEIRTHLDFLLEISLDFLAFNWFKKGAEAGNSSSMINLGFCYEFGRGVEANPSDAMKWYQKAMDNGQPLDEKISLRIKECKSKLPEVIFSKAWVSAPENQDIDKWNIDIHLHFQINNCNNKKLYVRMTTALYNQPNVVLSIQDKECIPDSDHCEWEDFQSYINEHSQKWPNKDARLKLTTTFQVLDESKQPLTMATSEVTYNVYHKIQRFQKNELYLNMAINNFEETGQIIVPENVVPKVIKIIDGYNKKAKKWGYEILSYNEDTRTISGKFKPKEDARKSKSGFFSEMKEAYKYGDLGEEWERILRLCRLK